MDFQQLGDILLHLDQHLANWTVLYGTWIYLIVFLIVFCETGLVVLPFLPGDSLLFALGAMTSIEGSVLTLPELAICLISAGILGDALNYFIGAKIGPRIFSSTTSRWLNREHLIRTHNFYEKHGPFTIVIARFAPIIRTFAPFVAGIGKMSYRRFALYNITGAILWVVSFLLLGHYFGNLPVVKRNFEIVVFGIVAISCIPIVVSWWQNRRQKISIP